MSSIIRWSTRNVLSLQHTDSLLVLVLWFRNPAYEDTQLYMKSYEVGNTALGTTIKGSCYKEKSWQKMAQEMLLPYTEHRGHRTENHGEDQGKHDEYVLIPSVT